MNKMMTEKFAKENIGLFGTDTQALDIVLKAVNKAVPSMTYDEAKQVQQAWEHLKKSLADAGMYRSIRDYYIGKQLLEMEKMKVEVSKEPEVNENTKITFAKHVRGHIPVIECMLKTYGDNDWTWDIISKATGWEANTANKWYNDYLEKVNK